MKTNSGASSAASPGARVYTLLNEHSEPVARLPLLEASMGTGSIDTRQLLQDGNVTSFDPAFGSTASTSSKVTFVDGDRGLLLYRGYHVDDLVKNASFLEVCFLLIYGELPSKAALNEFVSNVTNHTMVHEQLHRFYQGFRNDAHPMAMMLGVVGALSAFYPDSTNVQDADQRQISIIRLLAKMPTIGAMAYKYSVGQPFVHPSNHLDYAENFLRMMFSVPSEDYVLSAPFARALSTLLIVQADHEQNASTSTVRTVASSLANPFACVTAGIASLWGPAHGGANEAAVKMLLQVGDTSNIPGLIDRVKRKELRLTGFGHRVYKNYDPRALILQNVYKDLVEAENLHDDPLFELATNLESIALKDEYFVERRLYPNVDFYSGLIMRAMGVPSSLFTGLFVIARTAGWLAHWKEAVEDGQLRISRPRQLYVGHSARVFVPLDDR